MFRPRPAAPADERDAEPQVALRVVRHVVRRGGIEEPAVHGRRNPGVRLRDEGGVHRLPHPLQRREAAVRPHPTVRAHRVRPRLEERPGRRPRPDPERRDAALGKGDQRRESDVGSDLADSLDGEAALPDPGECLDLNGVGARLHQRPRLFAESSEDLLAHPLVGEAHLDPGGAHRTEDERLRPRRLPRHPHSGRVDRRSLRSQAVARQLDPVRAEGVRRDHLRPGGDVGGMDAPHALGIGAVQIVERAPDPDPSGIERRAHRTVAHPCPPTQEGDECGAIH